MHQHLSLPQQRVSRHPSRLCQCGVHQRNLRTMLHPSILVLRSAPILNSHLNNPHRCGPPSLTRALSEHSPHSHTLHQRSPSWSNMVDLTDISIQLHNNSSIHKDHNSSTRPCKIMRISHNNSPLEERIWPMAWRSSHLCQT